MVPTVKPTVVLLGNPDIEEDSLPLRLMPTLEERLPDFEFRTMDPNEEWEVPVELTVVDTVINATEPLVHESLDRFADPPRVSMHDFDALSQLRLLLKIGRVETVRVIGLPPGMPEPEAIDFVTDVLTEDEPS